MPCVAFYRGTSPIVDDLSWEVLAVALGADGAWEGPCTSARAAFARTRWPLRAAFRPGASSESSQAERAPTTLAFTPFCDNAVWSLQW